MFEAFKQKREIVKITRKIELNDVKTSALQYSMALKSLEEANNMVVDNESKDWNLISSSGILTPSEHKEMLISAHNLYLTNPHARAIVRTLVKFILGIGPSVEPEDENKGAIKTWEEFVKINKFSRREKEIVTRLFRDGEVFLRKFIGRTTGVITLRFINASLIANPSDIKLKPNVTYGIETNPEDIEEVRAYWKVNQDGKFKERIKAEEVIHLKIFADSDEKRGNSIYKVCANRIKQYDDWLEDRIVLNKVRSAVALVRKVSGSAQKIKSIRDNQRSDITPSDRMKVKTPYRGTIITASKDIEYEMHSPNINATDVKDDGRAMLLSVAAGVGFPEMMFTADFSNANYSSSLIAQNPFVREIEEWQDYFKDFYKELFEDIIEAKIKYGNLTEGTSTDVVIEFPPLIAADIEKIAKAYEILFKYKIVSKKTWRYKMGLNDKLEEAYLEDEGDDDFLNPGGVPGAVPGQGGQIRMPISPVNQYSQQNFDRLVEALKEKDWERVIEIGEEMDLEDDKKDAKEGKDIDEDKFENFKEDIIEAVKEIQINIAPPNVTINQEGANIKVEPTETNLYQEGDDIDISVPEREVTVKNEPAVINVTVPEREINISQESPVVNIEVPEKEVNVNIKQEAPIVNVDIPKQEVTIIKEEVNKEVKKDKVKIRKTVIRDKDGKVLGIEEEDID